MPKPLKKRANSARKRAAPTGKPNTTRRTAGHLRAQGAASGQRRGRPIRRATSLVSWQVPAQGGDQKQATVLGPGLLAITEALSAGRPLTVAAERIGLTRHTLQRCAERQPEVAAAIEVGLARDETWLLDKMRSLAKQKQFMALAYLLNNRHGYRDGQPTNVAVGVSINLPQPATTEAEGEAILARMRATHQAPSLPAPTDVVDAEFTDAPSRVPQRQHTDEPAPNIPTSPRIPPSGQEHAEACSCALCHLRRTAAQRAAERAAKHEQGQPWRPGLGPGIRPRDRLHPNDPRALDIEPKVSAAALLAAHRELKRKRPVARNTGRFGGRL